MVRVTLAYVVEPGKTNVVKDHPDGTKYTVSDTGLLSIVGEDRVHLAAYAPHSWAVVEVIE